MNLYRTPLLLCSLSLLAQDVPALPEVPPAPVAAPVVAPAPAVAPAAPAVDGKLVGELAALKAELEALQVRLRQLGEDDILRGAELKKAQGDMARKLTALEALPEQIKGAGDQARAAEAQSKAIAERLAGQESGQAVLLQARLEGERKALVAVLDRLGGVQKELQGAGPLEALEKSLLQFEEGNLLGNNPQFNAVLAFVKDKLAKGPLGTPLKDPASTRAYFANPALGASWMVSAIPMGPGWESDKLKNLEKGLDAVDQATRLEVETRTGLTLLAGLRREAGFLRAATDELLRHAQVLLDPEAASSAALEGEALAAKAEAAFKPMLEALAQSGLTAANRDSLVELACARDEAQSLILEHRLLLRRMLGVAAGLSETFTAFQKQTPARNLPALEPLLKAAEETRGRLGATIINNAVAFSKDVARLETAGYPVAVAKVLH